MQIGLVATAILLVTSPALGADTPAGTPNASAATTKAAKTKDPNRVICETTPVTGSRLTRRRICKTAQEWDDLRHLQKQEIQRGQMQKGVISPN